MTLSLDPRDWTADEAPAPTSGTHDRVAITGPTGGNIPEGPATGSIRKTPSEISVTSIVPVPLSTAQ